MQTTGTVYYSNSSKSSCNSDWSSMTQCKEGVVGQKLFSLPVNPGSSMGSSGTKLSSPVLICLLCCATHMHSVCDPLQLAYQALAVGHK